MCYLLVSSRMYIPPGHEDTINLPSSNTFPSNGGVKNDNGNILIGRSGYLKSRYELSVCIACKDSLFMKGSLSSLLA